MVNFRLAFAVVLLSLLIQGCETTPKPKTFVMPLGTPAVERAEQPYLEQTYAQLRAQQIHNIAYRLSFELDDQSQVFSGIADIQFDLASNNTSAITLDFDGGEIQSVTVNGKSAEWQHKKWFVRFAPEYFVAGKNTLTIHFTHPYATAGDGLHRYKDLQTGRVYLYSNFEPFNAHKMFPHFDQPNLKATYVLDVNAPKDWQVISSTRESNVTITGDKKHWQFPTSARMASYVFSLHAGPFAVWEDKTGSIPLRLFARQELAEFVNADEWFTFTQQAFSFYNEYFNYPYPFKKYDQIIVPDFNSGAMENIGSVTFNENFISRGQKTYLARMRNANVISHEMAHMWFGDLVTMDWWNGLWLNESFATFMATYQQTANSEFKKDAWDVFYSGTKQWAYTDDQKVTTHPIELPVANTAEAFTNFDGITYGKGASVLKQLAHFVGEENFRRGVANYLRKYAYGNTTLNSFMDEVAKASHQDLSGWSQEWLNSAGVNTITTDFSCEGEGASAKIKQVDLLQSAPEKFPVLRQQRINLAFYNYVDGKVVLGKILSVNYAGARTSIVEAKGLQCPALVYPNVNDWGYVKVNVDKKSQAFLMNHMNEFSDGLRMMLWQNLWDDVLDVRLSLTDYVEFVKNNIEGETQQKQIAALLSKLALASNYFWQMHWAGQENAQAIADMENLTYRQLMRAESGATQRAIFEFYLALANSTQALERIRGYLLGQDVPAGLAIDQDLRWALLLRLNKYQYKDYRELTELERKKDQSDLGLQMAIVCEVIRPDLAIKEKWVNELLSPNTEYKLATLRRVMMALFPANQNPLRNGFETKVVNALPALSAQNSERFMSAFADSTLLPHKCTAQGVVQLEAVRDKYSYLSPALAKALSVNVQEEQRCVDMMAKIRQ